MKDLLFKRRVRDGEYFADHYFTAAESTEEILPFDQEGTSQEISTDWAEHYAQQTSVLNVHSSMAFSLEELPVDRINTKYFMGDNTQTDSVYYDECSAPSHLNNCVEGGQEEDYGTSYFVEVVDATRPACFYMEGVQKRVHYVPFMGWFTSIGRNPSRRHLTTEEIAAEETPTTKKATVNYHQLRQIYDAFGSVFFGYVRAMNLAHQGWMYTEAQELAKTLDEDNECGVIYPDILDVQKNYIDVQYTSRSGNKYRFTHSGRENGNLYYQIDVEYPSNSQLAEIIDSIVQSTTRDKNRD